MAQAANDQGKTPAPAQTGTGKQQDDNIDDLGRNVNDPKSKPVDQPIIKDPKGA